MCKGQEKYSQILTYEFLKLHYIDLHKSSNIISKETNIPQGSVLKYLKKHNIPRKTNHKEYIGHRFGNILITGQATTKNQTTQWYFICDCGTSDIISTSSINSNVTRCKKCYSKAQSNKYWQGHGEICGTYWNRTIKQAIERNLEFNITIEYAWQIFLEQNGRCKLSGRILKLERQCCRDYKTHTASIDRIDSSIGYVIGNVQWIHKEINMLKTNMSDIDFINICHEISRYQTSLTT